MTLRFRWRVLTVRGVEVYISAAILIALAIVFALWPNGKGAGMAVGLLFVELSHELGHAVVIRWLGVDLREIQISLIGGYCRYDEKTTRRQDAIISWGGPLVNLATVVVAVTLWCLGFWPKSLFSDGLFYTLSVIAALDAFCNLLPIRGYDGEHAWRLFKRRRLRRKRRR